MITLFFGADELAVAEAVAERKAQIPADFADLNVVVLDGRKLKLPALAAACEAAPFLSDNRMVIVEGAIKHLRAGQEREAIRAYLPRVPAGADLLFVEGAEVDRRSSLFSYIKQAGEIREFQPRQGAQLQQWLRQRAAERGVQLLPEAGVLLVELAGNDGRTLLNELEKLSLYVGPSGTIRQGEVRLLVADDGESSVFEFVDTLAARQLPRALRLLHDLFADGVAAHYLLFMAGRQVRVLLAVSELTARRLSADAMASELGQKPFVIRKAIGQANHFDRVALLELHDRLVELDHWSKTGRVEAETALELLVAETCGAGTASRPAGPVARPQAPAPPARR